MLFKARTSFFITVTAGLVLALVLVAAGQSVNIDEVFPPDPPEVRDMLIQACTACHNFVPIVIGQKTNEEWIGTFDRHRPLALDPFGITKEQEQALIDYCNKYFNPDAPIPELPQALLDAWTSY